MFFFLSSEHGGKLENVYYKLHEPTRLRYITSIKSSRPSLSCVTSGPSCRDYTISPEIQGHFKKLAKMIKINRDPSLYSIRDSRENCICGLWIFIFALVLTVFSVGLVYISSSLFFVKDPEPSFSNTTILKGYRHDFFHQASTFNESQRLCASRNSFLIVFNNSEEHRRFNEFVANTFMPYVRNQTHNYWKRTGLQIWTGIRIVFKSAKLTQFDWPDRMESPLDMMKFYAISQEARLCHATTKERHMLYRKQMESRTGSKQFIVKDFTGKFENTIGEPGCWQIRVLEDNEKLLLPFVCKSKIDIKNSTGLAN